MGADLRGGVHRAEHPPNPRKRKPTGRSTIQQVAENAQVSVSAVSKVLRGAYGVSPEMRARVESSIDALKYRPLASARGMRGRTFAVGVILPDLRNPFFADLVNGLTDALSGEGYQSIFGISETSSEIDIQQTMLDRQVDGLVLVGSTCSSSDLGQLGSRVPVVAIGYHCPEAVAFDTVNNDDVEGARLATRHLVEAGFRDIAMVGLEADGSTVAVRRESGYRQEMTALGLERHFRLERVAHRPDELVKFARALLRSADRPQAVFCWSDFAALHVGSAAERMGLSVPADLGIVGYDNSAFCDLAQIDLTSVDQCGTALGHSAASRLVERLRGRNEPTHDIVAPRLIPRASTLTGHRSPSEHHTREAGSRAN